MSDFKKYRETSSDENRWPLEPTWRERMGIDFHALFPFMIVGCGLLALYLGIGMMRD